MRRKTIPPAHVYTILLNRFGPQGWWPTTPPGSLLPRYYPGRYGPRTERESFEICAGAILTQNTAWTNVEKAIHNLVKAKALSARAIAAMPHGRLAALIRPSGYYNQKAGRLKDFAAYLCTHYGGKISALLDRPRAQLREELLALKGIGPETADSMMLYAGGVTQFVVDAYTRRVGQRLGWFTTDSYDEIQNYFGGLVRPSTKIYNEYHALIVALCKEHCRKRPVCADCVLLRRCLHADLKPDI